MTCLLLMKILRSYSFCKLEIILGTVGTSMYMYITWKKTCIVITSVGTKRYVLTPLSTLVWTINEEYVIYNFKPWNIKKIGEEIDIE